MHPSSSHRATRNPRIRPSVASVPRHLSNQENNKENLPDPRAEVSRTANTTATTTSTASRQVLKVTSRENIPALSVPRPPPSVAPGPKRRLHEQQGKEVKIQASSSATTRSGGVNLLRLPNSRPMRPEQISGLLKPKQSSAHDPANIAGRSKRQPSTRPFSEKISTDASRPGLPATTRFNPPTAKSTATAAPITEMTTTAARPLDTGQVLESIERTIRPTIVVEAEVLGVSAQAPQSTFLPSRPARHTAPLPSPGVRRTQKMAPAPKQPTTRIGCPSGLDTTKRMRDTSRSETQVMTRSIMDSTTTQISHERTDEVEGGATVDSSRGKRRRELDEPEELRLQLRDSEMEDPMLVGEYSDDIFTYMRELEIMLAPSLGYLESRPRDGWSIRRYCVKIACQVCDIFNTIGETIFLAVNLLDRFLSCRPLLDLQYQAPRLAMTCVLVASKFEERNPFARAVHFLALLDRFEAPPLDPATFRNCESFLLRVIDYQLGWPGPLSFLRRCSRADDCDQAARLVAKYILEVILIDERFVLYRPSLQAAAALYVGRSMQGREDWPQILVRYSGYSFVEMEPAVLDMVSFLSESHVATTVPFHKYQTRQRSYVSLLVARWIERRSHTHTL